MFVHQPWISQEELLEYHQKAESMFKVLLESNLSDYSYSALHHYLWGINDIISRAKNLNESLLNVLLKRISAMEPTKGSSGTDFH